MNPLLRPERGFLDHALAGIGCVAAGLGIGLSLNTPSFAAFVSGLAALSTILGYIIAKAVADKKSANIGTWLWVIISLGCFFFVRTLNNALPEQPFEFRIMIGATLSWMIILCPLVSWRDQTLLFLTLPSLALFGLVGTFDYPQGTWLFFGFLLCAGILYSRVHQRSMLERAEHVGEGQIELLRRGAWRWMAGPEWALASGFIIIILSLISAPMLQASVQGVAGRTNFQLPQPSTPPPSPSSSTASASDVTVGRGPISPTMDPVFRVRINEYILLRGESMNVYTGIGWTRRAPLLPEGSVYRETYPFRHRGDLPFSPWSSNRPPGLDYREFEPLEFELHSIQRLSRVIYRPGPVFSIFESPGNGAITAVGEVYLSEGYRENERFRGVAANSWGAFFKDRKTARAKLPADLENSYLDTSEIHPDVRERAISLVKGLDSDYDKVMAIKRFIEDTCTYNLDAEAVPPRSDAAQYFLFESQEGYCDLFATAMVTMIRSAGLPARYTMGYLMNDRTPDSEGFFTVREKDYHAWCEVYFEGYGWMPFDATEGAAAVPGSGVGDTSDDQIPFFERPAVQDALRILIIVALIVPTALYLVRQAIQSRRFIKDNEIVYLHSRFINAVESLTKSPKRFSQTTAEFVAQSTSKLGSTAEAANVIADQFDSALYGPDDSRSSRMAELRPAVAAFKKAVREERKQAK